MNPAVETHDLRKTYRTNGATVDALRGVDLHIDAGEFMAVMGPSGCGKSTLLHLLGGLDHPTSGEVRVAGRQMGSLKESARAMLRRETIGFVFQAYNLIPNLSVADNVDLPGLLSGSPPAEVARKRTELLDALGLNEPAQPTSAKTRTG